jgi:hypothetical protein
MLPHLRLCIVQCEMSVLQLAMPSAVCGSVDIGSVDSGLQCLLPTDYVTSFTVSQFMHKQQQHHCSWPVR